MQASEAYYGFVTSLNRFLDYCYVNWTIIISIWIIVAVALIEVVYICIDLI